jgi:predicted nucleic acid-binding protein
VTVLVDTPIWSLAYRRGKRTPLEQQAFDEWAALVRQQRAVLIGPVRQEALSGFSQSTRFDLLRVTLRAYSDLEIATGDYEMAAKFANDCRRRGIQGSATDFLICAISVRYDAPVFTIDRDFKRYAAHTGIRLHVSTV